MFKNNNQIRTYSSKYKQIYNKKNEIDQKDGLLNTF